MLTGVSATARFGPTVPAFRNAHACSVAWQARKSSLQEGFSSTLYAPVSVTRHSKTCNMQKVQLARIGLRRRHLPELLRFNLNQETGSYSHMHELSVSREAVEWHWWIRAAVLEILLKAFLLDLSTCIAFHASSCMRWSLGKHKIRNSVALGSWQSCARHFFCG